MDNRQSHSPHLKQHLRPHAEETVDYPEREYHRHAVDVPKVVRFH
jgi:hypothetical protein